MRLLVLAFAVCVSLPAAGQTVSGGLGWGHLSGGQTTVTGGALVSVPVRGWTVALDVGYTKEVVLTRDWVDRGWAAGVLAGRSVETGRLRLTALAGPTVGVARRAPNVSPAAPEEPGVEVGAAVLGRAEAFPFRSVPVGLSVDLGGYATAGAAGWSMRPGLSVRF